MGDSQLELIVVLLSRVKLIWQRGPKPEHPGKMTANDAEHLDPSSPEARLARARDAAREEHEKV